MRRELTASILLLLLLLASVWNIRRVDSLTDQLEESLSFSAQAAEAGDFSRAHALASEALALWLRSTRSPMCALHRSTAASRISTRLWRSCQSS